jgi:hypothetical protein
MFKIVSLSVLLVAVSIFGMVRADAEPTTRPSTDHDAVVAELSRKLGEALARIDALEQEVDELKKQIADQNVAATPQDRRRREPPKDDRPDPSVMVTQGSIWVGQWKNGNRNIQGGARLTILERDGAKFEAEYADTGANKTLVVVGSITASGRITCVVDRLTGGDWQTRNLVGQTWTGQVNDKRIKLNSPGGDIELSMQ